MAIITEEQREHRRVLGDALRRERERAKVSRFRLAVVAGSTTSGVQQAEMGNAREETILRLSSALAGLERHDSEAAP